MSSPDESFDVVIVGAGPAGCVLARRLTENPDRRVLLLEAGPDYGPDPSAWPPEMADAMSYQPDSHAWGHFHADRPADQALPLSQARVVGGSSTINSCIWLRGSAIDYDGWAARGNPGWAFTDLLPYFRRSEADPIGGPLHGTDGPVPVWRVPAADRSPVDQAMVTAAETLGFPPVADLNGHPVREPGVGPTPRNVADGRRMNAAWTYLAPVRTRPNAMLRSQVLIDRVLIERGRAVAVQAVDGRVFRGNEIIICAGAFGSPAILLRSGVGPAEDLRTHSIRVVADRPGVGSNLQDHPFLGGLQTAAVNAPHAPAATSSLPTTLKARSSQASEEIDLHLYHGQYFDAARGTWVLAMSVSLAHTQSRGQLRLSSADPLAPLAIDHRHLTEPGELEALCDGAELARDVIATPSLANMITPLPGLFPAWHDRSALRAAVRASVATTFHPSSTCRMDPSTDPGAVVDHTGRVHGVDGLRVVDASIFPTGPRANLHCTVVAVAEKLAGVIRHENL
jgi:choline dehydrogenase-like flavoprotein